MVVRRRYICLYFALTIPLAWLFWIPWTLAKRGLWTPPLPVPDLVWSSLGAISPLLALGIIGRISRKQVQLDAILKGIRLRDWRSPWVVTSALFAPGLSLVLTLIYFGVEAARGSRPGSLQFFNPGVFATLGWWLLLIMPIHFCAALITSPLFEEPGWRGFAFEQLSRRLPRDVASLLVGSYWWLWHQGSNLAWGLQPSLLAYLSMLLDSFTLDAFYTLSRRNLFAAMLGHQAMGIAIVYLFPMPAVWYLFAARLVAVGILRYLVHRQAGGEQDRRAASIPAHSAP